MSNNITTLKGGKSVSIALAVEGTFDSVFVKQLPVRLFPEYLKAQDDEPAMIALATGKDAKYIDELPIESFEKLVAEIEEVNSDFFQHWLSRRRQRVAKIMPPAEAAPAKPTSQSSLPSAPLNAG